MTGSNETRLVTYGKILSLILVLAARMCYHNSIQAQPLGDLSMSLSLGSPDNAANQQQTQAGKTIEKIMNDDYRDDFMASIATLSQMASALEGFVNSEQLTNQVGKQSNLISAWAASKGSGIPSSSMAAELDFITATFWSRFKPLVESVIAERPSNLGPNDLDFRCKRTAELKEIRTMSSQSALYSIYLDTFFSDLHKHCLLRKLALIKNNRVAPSSTVRQFVDIYLELPTVDPMRAKSKEAQEQAAHQLIAGHALDFNIENAMARIGPLGKAAELVFDPRTALSLTPDAGNIERLVNDFLVDCAAHNSQLGQIWGNFDDIVGALSSQTSNLVDLNNKVKFAAPQLVYGSICSQLSSLPRSS